MIVAAPMEEGPSVALFILLMVGICIAIAVTLPALLRRFSLSASVLAIGFVGPILGIIGALLGAGAMTLSGREVRYTFFVSGITALAMLWVGLRVSRPLARDLQTVVASINRVAAGDRSPTGIERKGEIGHLVSSVDGLSQSLVEAEQEREIADQERLAVVTALSHDLRTPLAALLVSVDALQDGVGSSETHLRAIRRNVIALERLVDDLFLLARADSGSLALRFEPLDLAELVDEAIDAVAPVAAKKAVEIRSEVHGPLLVDGDHVALGRVWRNLLDNAVRHAPNNSIVVVSSAVSASEDTDIPERVTIEVLDQGEGFPPTFIASALERFTQADDSRHGGAGLGLSITNALASAHGGVVELFEGPGGRVRVCLPCTR